jgi:hypothetical protein
MTGRRPERDDFIGRHRRAIGIVLCVVAIVATAFAWAGLSLREALAALPF